MVSIKARVDRIKTLEAEVATLRKALLDLRLRHMHDDDAPPAARYYTTVTYPQTGAWTCLCGQQVGWNQYHTCNSGGSVTIGNGGSLTIGNPSPSSTIVQN